MHTFFRSMALGKVLDDAPSYTPAVEIERVLFNVGVCVRGRSVRLGKVYD